MVEGGGFCEKHGPYDPPHRTCPFCAIENQQRQAYGPPQPALDREMPAGFRRQTVEPEPKPEPEPPVELTEVVSPRPASEGDRAPLGWLIIKEPVEQRGTVLAVRANQIIGRNGDVQWNDPRLSRQHARLTFEPPEGAPGRSVCVPPVAVRPGEPGVYQRARDPWGDGAARKRRGPPGRNGFCVQGADRLECTVDSLQ